MTDEKYLIECELENQKFMGKYLIKKFIYTMKDKDFLLYYYNKFIKDNKVDQIEIFNEFKRKHKTNKAIEKLKIELINAEINAEINE